MEGKEKQILKKRILEETEKTIYFLYTGDIKSTWMQGDINVKEADGGLMIEGEFYSREKLVREYLENLPLYIRLTPENVELLDEIQKYWEKRIYGNGEIE